MTEDIPVFIVNGRDSNVIPGRVMERASDQSYLVDNLTGISRRNRSHLNIRTDEQNDAQTMQKIL